MTSQSSKPNNGNNNLPTTEIMQQWLQNQKEEQKTKQLELEIQKDENQKTFELAKENLKLQAEYMKDAPRHLLKRNFLVLGFFTIILLIVVGFMGYCVYLGKADIAMRILEVVSTAILSGGGGYFAGKNAKQKKGGGPSDDLPQD
ncbi:hypothetical protein MKQ68_02775 [Chitinophaga horti]|uniref:Uncharacterized protein n=1 Tax=Chitinophaga horti TaxID=2920382 RepID=A0ABY6J3D7_9BACT|nr:hypothetical protein [Chitinophaga horti]UYQ94015.1 hypothetical protein MKQ68_02775 [Chitinophaga horti]